MHARNWVLGHMFVIGWQFRTEATAWWSRRCSWEKPMMPASVPIHYTPRTALPWQPLTSLSFKVCTVQG